MPASARPSQPPPEQILMCQPAHQPAGQLERQDSRPLSPSLPAVIQAAAQMGRNKSNVKRSQKGRKSSTANYPASQLATQSRRGIQPATKPLDISGVVQIGANLMSAALVCHSRAPYAFCKDFRLGMSHRHVFLSDLALHCSSGSVSRSAKWPSGMVHGGGPRGMKTTLLAMA